MLVYVAGPLFTPDERRRLARVADAVEDAGHEAHLPFDEEAFTVDEDRQGVYQACVDGVRGADALVAVLDGADADSGTSFEVGFARARGTPVLGIRADYRTLGPEGRVNTMLEQGVSHLATPSSPAEEAEAVAAFLEDQPAPSQPRLARDKVPQMRRRGGDDPEVRRVEGEEHVTFLKRYLLERSEQLLAADEVGEKDLLTDVLEGVETLIEARGFTGDSLRRVKEKREDEFGGLDQGYVLEDPPQEGTP